MKNLFILLTITITLFGCASTKQETKVEVSAPIETPTTVQDTETTVITEEVKPTISAELEALNNAVASKDDVSIETAAHVIIDKDPTGQDAIHAYVALASSALKDSPATARLYIERATEIDPNDETVLITLGKIAHAQNQDDEALTHFSKASDAAPNHAIGCIESAKILITYLDLERALDRAKCAYEREPKNCSAIAIYADTLYAIKSYEDAANAYESYETAHCTQSEDVLKRLAKLYETHLSNAKRACEVYSTLVTLSPDNANYKASRDYNCSNNQ